MLLSHNSIVISCNVTPSMHIFVAYFYYFIIFIYIFQPDVTAPGVNILAAFTELISPTGFDLDTRRIPYIFMSGTSMSCPHVSGVAGLLKSANPHWSPSAIKSAIMTTGMSRYIISYWIISMIIVLHG